MKWETAKSFILVVLIGTSLILTFGMWNYQPERPSTDQAPAEEVSLGGTEENKRSLIKPSNIIFKLDGDYYGFKDPNARGQLYEKMQSWILENVRTEDGEERKTRNREIEVVFPDAFPIELLSSIFSFDDDDVTLPGWSFERIYITFNSERKSIQLEIPSIDGREKMTAIVNNPSQYDELMSHIMNLDADEYINYIVMDGGGKNIYFPAGEIVLPKKTMQLTTIDGAEMVEALFPTPSVVSSSTRGSELMYYSDSRQLVIGSDKLSMEFVNPYAENSQDSFTAVNLLDYSIDNINNHSGWTSNFVLTGLNLSQKEKRVEYRMYYQGYPVFNNANPDLALIEQFWNREQLEEYRRPLFKLNDSFDETDVTLESGQSLMEELTDEVESIQDITIGYRLKVEENEYAQPYVIMEPAWYVKKGGIWSLTGDSDEGGNEDAMGSD